MKDLSVLEFGRRRWAAFYTCQTNLGTLLFVLRVSVGESYLALQPSFRTWYVDW